MDEYLIKLDIIIRQTLEKSNSNDIFLNEIDIEAIKDISKNLKVISIFYSKKYESLKYKQKLEKFANQDPLEKLAKTDQALVFYEVKYKHTVEILQNIEAEIHSDEKNTISNKENINCTGYFDMSEFNKEEIDDLVKIEEENEYFEKRSIRQKLFFRLENENYIYEEEFEKMKNQLKYLEMSKSSILQEINIKNNYLKSFEEQEKEFMKKKLKSMENSAKIRQNISENMEEKCLMLEKIEDYERKRKEESEKLSNISKNNILSEKSNIELCHSILLANEELKKVKEENENLISSYLNKFQELDHKFTMSPSRIENTSPDEFLSKKLRACFSPTSNNILIFDKDEKKSLFRAKLNTPIKSANELEYFSDEEFNFYKNKSGISLEEKKSNSNFSESSKNRRSLENFLQKSNDDVLRKSDSFINGKNQEKEFSDEVQINSYSNESKKQNNLIHDAKIISSSHIKSEEIKNKIAFKSSELKKIIEFINNKKPQNLPNVKEKMKTTECFCGIGKCIIF